MVVGILETITKEMEGDKQNSLLNKCLELEKQTQINYTSHKHSGLIKWMAMLISKWFLMHKNILWDV